MYSFKIISNYADVKTTKVGYVAHFHSLMTCAIVTYAIDNSSGKDKSFLLLMCHQNNKVKTQTLFKKLGILKLSFQLIFS